MIMGLIVSLFQAVTQIQEMTLTFVPKNHSCYFDIGFFGTLDVPAINRICYLCFESIPDTTR